MGVAACPTFDYRAVYDGRLDQIVRIGIWFWHWVARFQRSGGVPSLV
jgi:hypothetical protein